MKLYKVHHRGLDRIKIELPNNREYNLRIKQIKGYAFSRTHAAWLIPYTKEAYNQLRLLFPEHEIAIETKGKDAQETQEVPLENQVKTEPNSKKVFIKGINIICTGRRIIITLPKNEQDIHFINGLKYSNWDVKNFCWVVPNYPGNLEKIKDYFGERITKLEINEQLETELPDKRSISTNELLAIKTRSGRLKLIFGFHKELTSAIKKLPYHSWDRQNKWWTIPYSETLKDKIRLLCEKHNYKFTYEEEPEAEGKAPKQTAANTINYKQCPNEYTDKLKEMRYSESTLRTYKALFTDFINYYHKVDYKTISEPAIIEYLRYLVTERMVSVSYQNQAINAIKFYYEKVLGGQRKFYFIDRPLKEKTLPVVLSEEEITSILKATENLKHKCMLMLTYSAGLRVSELVGLKIKDIDSNRMQIRITQAKGKKDRYTLLAKKTLEVLRLYYSQYKPKEWLFEGAEGDKYAVRSIQQVLKQSTRKAGILKRVSMHTLRHSFATHLLEHNTDLRYIQSLLGHESSKTTEVYTHITTKGIGQIKSPLDHLDI